MNAQMELHTTDIKKCAWIDPAKRIVSFQKIGEASFFTASESDFWHHIMALVNVGYRLQ